LRQIDFRQCLRAATAQSGAVSPRRGGAALLKRLLIVGVVISESAGLVAVAAVARSAYPSYMRQMCRSIAQSHDSSARRNAPSDPVWRMSLIRSEMRCEMQ
jgi:hypothetical protein